MITLNFDEVLKRIYNAKKGVEVRYGLGQGFEYCKQFADEAQGYATNAKASADKAEQTVAGIEQTKTDAVQAVQNAQSTATTAVTTKQTEAVQAVDDERDAALQQVADSTQAAQTAASNAAASEQAAQTSKEAAASSATAASGSASAAATSESNAASSAENSEASAARSEAAAKKAEAVVSTDKTLAVPGAPADAAAVGDIILDRTKETPQPIFYNKAEVEAKIKEILAAQREEDLARIKFWASNDPTSPASFIGGTWERIEDCTIWGASDTHPAGTKLEAGLPNITGEFSARGNEYLSSGGAITRASGAFEYIANSGISMSSLTFSTNSVATDETKFDASRSNPIYGASTTVQPPAYCLYLWRRVA